MDTVQFLEHFQDYLAPRRDTYEQAIYLYIFRHTRLHGISEATIGFKSARANMAFGIGEKGRPMSEATCYEKLSSLSAKGCIALLGTERNGTRVSLALPSEILGVLPAVQAATSVSLEDLDFFSQPELRQRILEREGHCCFYCFRQLDRSNHVIEHVVSRPLGNSSYRNVVAACLSCNNRKSDSSAEDYFRFLLREGFLNQDEFAGRLTALEHLRDGRLPPP